MSTFNFWYVIFPILVIGAVAIGCCTIVQSEDHLSGFWRLLQSKIFRALYIVLGGISSVLLLTAESYDGMVEFCKRFLAKSDSAVWLDLYAITAIGGFALVYMVILGIAMAIGMSVRPKQLRKRIQFESYRMAVQKPKIEVVQKTPLYIGCLHPKEILNLFDGVANGVQEAVTTTIGFHRGLDRTDYENASVIITVDPEILERLTAPKPVPAVDNIEASPESTTTA